MKMSEKKRSKVYAAISDPVVELRLNLMKDRPVTDEQLYRLELEIWRRVHEALKLEGPT